VLRRDEPLARLVSALEDVDRLVLLGDLIELRHGPVRDALAAATPVLAAVGAAVGADREVVIVPGNHDHHLIEPWVERSSRRGAPPALGVSCEVDWRAGEALATVVRRLGPARVSVRYPGVWIRDDVVATHGHYCDRHTTIPMLERLGAGAMAQVVREGAGGPRRADDYERVLAPIYAWLHAVAQSGGPELGRSSHGVSERAWGTLSGGPSAPGTSRRPRIAPRPRIARVRRRALVAGFPLAIGLLNRAGVGPLQANISGSELRRAGLRAFGEVLRRLEIDAPYAIFGHTHRAGPAARDAVPDWTAPTGAAVFNTGSWVEEPAFLGRDPSTSPYRPGFAVRVGDEGPPALINLLD
jgi:predicted phosphodiesterase